VEHITDEYINWLNDPATNQFLEVRFVAQTRDSVSEYIRSFYGESEKYIWAICLCGDGHMIGTTTLSLINPNHHSAGLGMMIGDEEGQTPTASAETLNLLLEFAFGELNLNRVTAENIANNHKSNFLLRRAGFTCEGKARDMYWMGDRYADGFHFAILQADWRSRNGERS